MYFEGKNIVVLGGSGSIGSEVVKQLLIQEPHYIIVFSHNENEIWESKQLFKKYDNVGHVLGDICTYEDVDKAVAYMDYVFNCAALKHVPICENNVMQAVNTNILGLNTLLYACKNNLIEKVLHISTDKAVEPANVMGATKLIGERLCLKKNTKETKISCVRFGNVYGSRGSIVPIVSNVLENGHIIPITDMNMSRYFITLPKAGDFILQAFTLMQGGEIFIPKMKEVRIKDLMEDLIKESGVPRSTITIEEIGIREGEKLKEKLMTDLEWEKKQEYEEMYIIK